jgi:hypothetical protein
MSLVLDNSINAEYFIFCDQDDVWDYDKLSIAIEAIQMYKAEVPVLYCGRSILVDQTNKYLRLSKHSKVNPSFSNSLVQNISSGNTMVFNRSARNYIMKMSQDIHITAHDWWAYQVVSGVGGVVYFDQMPTIRYRQHADNCFGADFTLATKISRLTKFFEGEYATRTSQHCNALLRSKNLLTPRNQYILDQFIKAKRKTGVVSFIYLFRAGIMRQSFLETLLIYVASLLAVRLI